MFPLWLKVGYTIFIGMLVPIYWRQYGPANFLWFSDVALIGALAALWFESPLLASTMVVSAFLVELAWGADFFARLFSGANLFGLSSYMFAAKIKTAIRA